MGIGFSGVKTEVTKVIIALLSDAALARDITYKKYESETFDTSAGYAKITYSDFSIRAIKIKHNEKSHKLKVGEIQAGDVEYLIKFSDMPSGESLKDLLIDGTDTLKVKGLENIFDLAWLITTEAK